MDIPALPYCRLSLSAKTPRRGYPASLQTIGDHVRARRLDLGLTQAELGEILGVSEPTVYNWEKHRTDPDLRTLPRVIDWLGYDPRPEREDLVARVAAERQRQGLSQRELAERLGTDQSSLSAWERGETRPSPRYEQVLEIFARSGEDDDQEG